MMILLIRLVSNRCRCSHQSPPHVDVVARIPSLTFIVSSSLIRIQSLVNQGCFWLLFVTSASPSLGFGESESECNVREVGKKGRGSLHLKRDYVWSGEAPPIYRQGCRLHVAEPFIRRAFENSSSSDRPPLWPSRDSDERPVLRRPVCFRRGSDRAVLRTKTSSFQAALEQMKLPQHQPPPPPVRQQNAWLWEPPPSTKWEALRRWWRDQWRALRSLVENLVSLEMHLFETGTKSWDRINNDEFRNRHWRARIPYGMVTLPFLVVIATRVVQTRFQI